MAITQVFTAAVAAGDVRKIRIMMKDSLLVDLTFHDFDEMSRLATDVPGLYDTHDGKELVSDRSAWDDNYMDKQMVEVMWNFSRERLNHLRQVIRFLRPVPENLQQPNNQDKGGDAPRPKGRGASHPKSQDHTDYWEQKKKDEQAGRIVKIVGGTVVGAVAGAVIGAVGTAVTGVSAGGAVLLCTAAGATVGGVAAASAIKGDKA